MRTEEQADGQGGSIADLYNKGNSSLASNRASRLDKGHFTFGGSRRGTKYDPISKQQWTAGETIGWDERVNMMRSFWAYRRYCNRLASDMHRAGILLSVEGQEDHDIVKAVLNRMRQLDVRTNFTKHTFWDLHHGDGFISLGLAEKGRKQGEKFIDQVVELSKIENLEYLTVFNKSSVHDIEVGKDVLASDFGKPQMLVLKPIDESSNDPELKEKRKIHMSRILHSQMRPSETDKWGVPVLDYLYDVLRLHANAHTSIERLFYQLVFKKVNSDALAAALASEDPTQRERVQANFEADLETGDYIVFGLQEDIELLASTGNLGGIEPLLHFVWDTFSAATDMPKSIWIGSAAGELSASKEDTRRWNAYVAGLQDNHLREHYHTLLEILVWLEAAMSQEETFDKLEWGFEFNSLNELTEEEDAEIEARVAEARTRLTGALVLLAERNYITVEELRQTLSDVWQKSFEGSTLDSLLANLRNETTDEQYAKITASIGSES